MRSGKCDFSQNVLWNTWNSLFKYRLAIRIRGSFRYFETGSHYCRSINFVLKTHYSSENIIAIIEGRHVRLVLVVGVVFSVRVLFDRDVEQTTFVGLQGGQQRAYVDVTNSASIVVFGGLEAFEKIIQNWCSVRRYRTNQLLIYKNVELDPEFKFRWLHFLSIVDEIRDIINDPVTRQVVGNTWFTSAVCLKIILIKITCTKI